MNFIKSAESYISLHKNLIEAAKSTKEMRKEKKILGDQLLEYMLQHDLKDHVHDGYELINKESSMKNKLSIEMIEGMLEQFVNENLDQPKIDKIVQAIVESELSDEKKNSLQIKKSKAPKEPKAKKSKTDTIADA
jgi:hypothetical protein